MLEVSFKNAILCDVTETEFEGKLYYKALIYSDRTIFPVAIKAAQKDTFMKAIAKRVTFQAVCRQFDGKNKYSFADDATLKVLS